MRWMLEFLIRGWEWEGDMVMARFTELVRYRTIFSTSLPNPSLTSAVTILTHTLTSQPDQAMDRM